MAGRAQRVIALRFVVDDKQAQKAQEELIAKAKRLEAQYKELQGAGERLTAAQRRGWSAQLRQMKSQDQANKYIIQYYEALRDADARLKAGLITERQKTEILQERSRVLAQLIAQERNLAASAAGSAGRAGGGPATAAPKFALNERTASATAAAYAKQMYQIGDAMSRLGKKTPVASLQLSRFDKMLTSINTGSGRGIIGTINDISFKFFVLTFATRQMGEILLRTFYQVGEEVQRMRFRMETLTGDATVFDKLYQSAQRLGTPLKELGSTFTRFAVANLSLGRTNDELVKMTETINVLGQLGGGSMQEITNASVQLGQALASDRLAGDELRSVMENLPILAVKLADKLGIGIGALREWGKQGKLTGEVVSGALLAIGEEMEDIMEQLPETTDRALARIQNAWMLVIDEMVRTVGTGGLTTFFDDIAESMATFADIIKANRAEIKIWVSILDDLFIALAGFGILVSIIKRLVAFRVELVRMKAASAATGGSLTGMRAGMTLLARTLGGPLIVAIGVAVTGFLAYKNAQREAREESKQFVQGLEELTTTFEDMNYAQRDAAMLQLEQAMEQLNLEMDEVRRKRDFLQERGESSRYQPDIDEATILTGKLADMGEEYDRLALHLEYFEAIQSNNVEAARAVREALEEQGASAKELEENWLRMSKAVRTAEEVFDDQLQMFHAFIVAGYDVAIVSRMITKAHEDMLKAIEARNKKSSGRGGKSEAEKEAERVKREFAALASDVRTPVEKLQYDYEELEILKQKATTQEQLNNILKKQLDITMEIAEIQNAAAAAQKSLDDSSFEQIAASVRTADEAYFDYLESLEELISKGYNAEIIMRAMAKAHQDWSDTVDKSKDNTKDAIDYAEQLESAMGDAMRSMIDGSSSAGDSMLELLDVLKKLVIEMLIIQPLMDAIRGANVGSSILSLFSADGNAFNNGRVMAYADGGVVNSPTVFPMAKGMGVMGEAGPEAVMPLKRGPNGKLGVEASGSGGTQIIINNNAPVEVTAKEERQTGGGSRIQIYVEKTVDNYFDSGGGDNLMGTTYGGRRIPR